MFTGLIEELGRLEKLEAAKDGKVIRIACQKVIKGSKVGDSIAVNGVCLTITRLLANGFEAYVSSESMKVSVLGKLPIGARANLERAIMSNTRMGGHMVLGHVDGIGFIEELSQLGESHKLVVRYPLHLGRYLVSKGSVCIDGISLTLNAINDATMEINIIPQTFNATNLQYVKPGCPVNIEVDIIAKYVERLLLAGLEPSSTGDVEDAYQARKTVTYDLLKRYGYVK